MITQSTTKAHNARKRYVPGSSRGPRSNATLLLQMAQAAEKQAEVAARIRELREDARLPQPAIAEKVGVTLRAYQSWEAGGGVSWPNLAKLAKVFQVSEEYLLYGPEGGKPPTTQMDRIERKLDTILEHLGLSLPDDPAAALERELETGALTSGPRGASTARGGRARQREAR